MQTMLASPGGHWNPLSLICGYVLRRLVPKVGCGRCQPKKTPTTRFTTFTMFTMFKTTIAQNPLKIRKVVKVVKVAKVAKVAVRVVKAAMFPKVLMWGKMNTFSQRFNLTATYQLMKSTRGPRRSFSPGHQRGLQPSLASTVKTLVGTCSHCVRLWRLWCWGTGRVPTKCSRRYKRS